MTRQDTFELHRIRRGVQEAERELMEAGRNTLLTPYPNTGKSYGFHSNLAALDEKGTILQPNRALREETRADAVEESGLTARDLPSFPAESPLADEGSRWFSAEAVEWYERGLPPASIYNSLADADRPPLEEDEYRQKMQEDLAEYDLLAGDPVHAFMSRSVAGRHVAMDDIDPYGSFVDTFDPHADSFRAAASEYLGEFRDWLLDRGVDPDGLTHADLLRPDERTRAVLAALTEPGGDRDSRTVIPDTADVTADTSRVLHVLMMTGDDASRHQWRETSEFDGGDGERAMVFTGVRHDDTVQVGCIPEHLGEAASLTMMTATPVVPVFRQFFEDLGVSSAIEDPMTRGQKEAYFEDVLDARVVQTTTRSRFVSGGNNVRADRLAVAVRDIVDRHGEAPVLISSKKALRDDDVERVVDHWGLDTVNFAKAIGTNAFDDEETALVWGAPHYGDDYVREVAAFCGDTDAEPVREDPETGERVETRWSTGTAQEIYENMTEGTVFQAMMRVGRSSESSATIYVETDKIPDDVPRLEPEGSDMFHLFTELQRDILDAGDALGDYTARQLADLLDASRRGVYSALEDLADKGAISVADRAGGDYNATQWRNELDAAAEGTVPERVRERLNNVYMENAHNLSRHEPIHDPPERVLTTVGGREPPELGDVAVGDMQLGLHNFG